jgi:antitoxin ChpS
MFETRIRKVGNSAVVTLSSEMLAALDAGKGTRFTSCGGMTAA